MPVAFGVRLNAIVRMLECTFLVACKEFLYCHLIRNCLSNVFLSFKCKCVMEIQFVLIVSIVHVQFL